MNIQYLKKWMGGEVARFILVGFLATAVHYGLYLILVSWINVNTAYTIGYVLSFLMNYFLSNYFTFKTKPTLKKGVGFIMSHIINYGLHVILLNFFLYLGITQSIAPLPVYAIAIPINFLLVRLALKGKATQCDL